MGEAKRRGSLEERIERSKQNELRRREQAERDEAERRKLQLEKALNGPRRAGGRAGGARGMMMVAAALTIGANSGMMGRHN